MYQNKLTKGYKYVRGWRMGIILRIKYNNYMTVLVTFKQYSMVVFVMGYDYGNDSVELYTSYNHSWAFYEYLDEEDGLRWIYGKSGEQIV